MMIWFLVELPIAYQLEQEQELHNQILDTVAFDR